MPFVHNSVVEAQQWIMQNASGDVSVLVVRENWTMSGLFVPVIREGIEIGKQWRFE